MLAVDYDSVRKQLFVGLPESKAVTIIGGPIAIRSIAKSNADAPGAADIAFSSLGSAVLTSYNNFDVNPGVYANYKLLGAGSAKGKDTGIFAATGNPEETDLVLQTGTALSALGMSLPGNAKVTAFGPLSANPSGMFTATISGTGVSPANNKLLLLDNGANVRALLRTGQPLRVAPLASASVSAIGEVLQPYQSQRVAAMRYTLAIDATTPVTAGSDSGILFFNEVGLVSSFLSAREGNPAFGGGGTFGQFSPKTSFANDFGLVFATSLKPTVGSAVDAVFQTTPDGVTTARLAQVDGAVPNGGGATYGGFLGVGTNGFDAVVHCKLKNSPATSNEAILRLPSDVIVARKGDAVDTVSLPGVTFAKFLRSWGSGFGVVMHCTLAGTGVTPANNQALIFKQNNGVNLVLIRTGSTASGIGSATLTKINAIDVNSNGSYAVLGTVSGSAATNQALWAGHLAAGDDNALRVLRLPALILRKGQNYTTSRTPKSMVRSIALRPVADSTTIATRGLGCTVGFRGFVAVEIASDRSQKELVVLTPFNFLD